MNRLTRTILVVGATLLSGRAFAQDLRATTSLNRVADKALEITLGAGYTQGFGDIGPNERSLTDLTSAGGEVALGVGYRINPRWMVGAYGSGARYALGDFTASGSKVWTATAGLQANYHFLPDNDLDPYVGLGSGWRGHWVDRGDGTDSRQGWDIARVTVGLDYRITPTVAIAPVIGATVTTFLGEELAGRTNFSNISSPKANVWVFGGIQGRFDLFGSTTSS